MPVPKLSTHLPQPLRQKGHHIQAEGRLVSAAGSVEDTGRSFPAEGCLLGSPRQQMVRHLGTGIHCVPPLPHHRRKLKSWQVDTALVWDAPLVWGDWCPGTRLVVVLGLSQP